MVGTVNGAEPGATGHRNQGEQIMSVTEQSFLASIKPVVFDLYRDIHKGIRAELFAVTGAAGRLDPADRAGRTDLALHIDSVVTLLLTHAQHEDAAVQPALEAHLPDLAARIETDHEHLERRIEAIAALAAEAIESPGLAQRADVHRVYLELASFTSAYLTHQDLEERDVMPALEQAIGVQAVLGIHGAIISSLTPEETAISMSLMLPAMNVDYRAEMLGGMRDNAPAEAFAAVWNLAGSVLTPADRSATASRLGLA
jgi:hypothetical protein